jgi:hypothetical protein
MSSSLSYLVAVIVILGLLALFAVIVRRVAGQGLRTDGSRGRGPRLGVVDTYALDRTRQLLIIRRDDVEHLLMIGGTNDVLIESNIVRALPASAIREQQVSLASQVSYDDAPVAQANYDDRMFAPQISAPVQSQAPQAQMPRLKVSPAAVAPQASPPRPNIEIEAAYAPQASQAQTYDTNEPAPSPMQQQAREALSNSELQALAKRLEASIPPLQPKPEKPVAPQQVSLAPEPKFAPQPAPMPIAPPPMPQPAPQPVPQDVQPMAFSSPQPIIPVASQASPVAPQTSQPLQQPAMPPSRAPVMPQAMQMPPQQKPVMPQMAPNPLQPPMPQQQAQPVAPPALPEAPQKDKQAAALDENLRRLLGRKLDPR